MSHSRDLWDLPAALSGRGGLDQETGNSVPERKRDGARLREKRLFSQLTFFAARVTPLNLPSS